jgi:hypothetical protein
MSRTTQKTLQNNYSIYELIRIESALRELSNREKLEAETAWDLLLNIQDIEPISKNFQEFQKQMFQKYSTTKDGQTGIDPERFPEYQKEIDLVGNKEEEVKLAKIPFDSLKNKDGKIHADILISLSKIIKK